MGTYRRTWCERIALPSEIAGSAVQSIRHEISRTHQIEVAVAGRKPQLILTVGPFWLAAASKALLAADTLTGHWWCNRGPLNGPGLAVREIELLDKYGTEVTVNVTEAEAQAYSRAMNFSVHLDDEDDS